MFTATASRPLSRLAAHDRIFFSGMAIAMALAVLIGFARTYYLSAFFGTNATISGGPFSNVVRVHALLFTAWVALFLVQTSLVATHRVAVHRRLGVAGGVLAAAMVVAGVTTALATARRGAAPPGVSPLAFLVVPMGDMVLFTVFVSAALWLRRDQEAHKRLMLLAYTAILVAAVARFPGVLERGPLWFFGLTFLPLLAIAALYDLRTRRRVHPVYLWGGALLIASVPLRLALAGTATWQRVAEVLVGK
jgi:hypothetical protein